MAKIGLKPRLIEQVVSRPDALAQLRARRFGLNKLLGRSPELELYVEQGDAHSELCLQLLPSLQARLKKDITVRVVPTAEAALYPEASRQQRFARLDVQRMAAAWGLSDSAQPPLPETAITDLAANHQRRAKLGHYLPAMWQFDGEWFWALDRLDLLEQRLRGYGLVLGNEPLATRNANAADLPVIPDLSGQSLEFFFSFRSPYSYLAAVTLQQQLAGIPVPVIIRPVLPMAMRGFKVPRAKRLYIVRDVKRLADQQGMAFGRIADPIGEGAKRCLKAFTVAEGVEQQLAFLVSAASGIWSEAIDVASDTGLKQVSERAGLDWSDVRASLAQDQGLAQANDNREALFDAGLWGVPSYRLGDFATWGQDRWWMIEEIIHRSQ